jgi:hypothetical protein
MDLAAQRNEIHLGQKARARPVSPIREMDIDLTE